MYTLSAFLLDYDKMNLLRTDELATTAAVKKRQTNKKHKNKKV